MPWTTRPIRQACRAKFSHAAPQSNEWVIDGLLLCSNVVRETNTSSAAALPHQALLASTSRSKKVCQCGVSRRAYRIRHGWLLNDDGAHRAASNRVIRSDSATGSPDMARGDQRSRNSGSIGWSALRTVLPLITGAPPGDVIS